ncbi:unnamed protein product [Blepharisma stoltei]|uniref:Uncharacterized protein n=1 Tax=Blepharisma stoltei TaxID=1481888 RepID=A0AAU9IB44_9CILI|nr:unnamed protein product [Blepharisma stoltei]
MVDESGTSALHNLQEELAKERQKYQDVASQQKNQERNFQRQIFELSAQLQAEQQKSQSLESSLQHLRANLTQISELQQQLEEALEREKQLKDALDAKSSSGSFISGGSFIGGGDQELIRELQEQNNKLKEELKQFKEYALGEIREKEKKILSLNEIQEDLQDAYNEYVKEYDKLQNQLEEEREQAKTDGEEMQSYIEDLMKKLRDSESLKESLERKQKLEDEDNAEKEKEKSSDENSKLKIKIESLEEELREKQEEIKDQAGKLQQMKKSREKLAEEFQVLEDKVMELERERESYLKGLENKQEAIDALEEEISTAAVGYEEQKTQAIQDLQKKCSQLERNIREMEKDREEKIEEFNGQLTTEKYKYNELLRAINGKDKEINRLTEKIKLAAEKNEDLKNKLRALEESENNAVKKAQYDFTQRLLVLTRENQELKEKIQEMQDQLDINKTSFLGEDSLFDELSEVSADTKPAPIRQSVRPPPSADTTPRGSIFPRPRPSTFSRPKTVEFSKAVLEFGKPKENVFIVPQTKYEVRSSISPFFNPPKPEEPKPVFESSIEEEPKEEPPQPPQKEEPPKLPPKEEPKIELPPVKTEETNQLKVEIAEKEFLIKNMDIEKQGLENQVKELFTSNRQLKKDFSDLKRAQDKLITECEELKRKLKSQANNVATNSEKSKLLVVEAERDMLKAEIQRLETELMLSKEKWAEHNNNLMNDLMEAEKVAIDAKLEMVTLADSRDIYKSQLEEILKKKKKWRISNIFSGKDKDKS